ncbi:unnamed protein product [Angiostrongylus costaricensis]|uniref:ShKT domain-containing protein n=1 Tax=Angiostrongylus costaricensis TaxID=334426 RepID=A0A0R3PT60_ANGCS|nr:unnamed protein product [Angiostrongylus costaricensis]
MLPNCQVSCNVCSSNVTKQVLRKFNCLNTIFFK